MLPSSILINCSTFLEQSDGTPLFKALPSGGEGFRKIKIRKRSKYPHMFEKHFDTAFSERYKDLRLRSMTAHPIEPPTTENMEMFYIFPINGFNILFNESIHSLSDYLASLSTIIPEDVYTPDLLKSLFSATYVEGSLKTAMTNSAEIIFYGMPYYYAIRKSLVSDYRDFVIS